MTVLVVSDLHLGAALGGDVLRRSAIRARLLETAREADRIVLLGDVLELREQPLAAVLAAAYPFFEELGEAIGGAPVTIVPGNHDHQLAAPLIEARRMRAGAKPLGLAETAKAGGSGPVAALARRMPDSEVTLSYPGTWLRDDVYAIHGHYLDCHITVPRVEVLGIAATRRVLGRDGNAEAPDDYEAIVAPLYAFTYQLAHATAPGERAIGSNISAKVWTRLNSRRPTAGSRALGAVGIPAAVAALNRLGLGPFTSDLSGPSLRRAGLRAMGEVVQRLGIEAEYVLFGHTHRAGPLERDAGDADWRAPGGARLLNTGSWLYEPTLLGERPHESPYWPGTCALVRDHGAPELVRLLADVPEDELRVAP